MSQMHLAAFLIAGGIAHSHALWRYPETDLDFLHPEIYQKIGQILERGKFDLIFYADRLAVGDRYGGNLAVGLHYGDQDAIRLDPTLVLAATLSSTRYIGLGATRSTTYNHPFSVARTFATLDHLSRGRAAWNVVTSMNDAEAQNFGVDAHLEHDRRYDRADEFIEVVSKLWDSWDEDALVLDRHTQTFADAEKVRYINHVGEWFKSRGPINIPRSPQGRPVIIQAGSSGRGKAFAARWAEVIFTVQHNSEAMKAYYEEVKADLPKYGREREDCKILPAFMPFVGATEAIALDKKALHNELVHPLAGLSTLSNHANYDFSQHDLDQPVPNVLSRGTQGLLTAATQLSQQENLTLGQLGKLYGQSVLTPQIAGTPSQIADWMESLWRDQACDGFVISPASLPGTFSDFVEHVVPELQRRKIYRQEYEGKTLRSHLHLNYPSQNHS